MTQSRFKELEERNKNDLIQLCFELFCEEKQPISITVFNQWFPTWLNIVRGGGIEDAIQYFKNNRVK